MRAKQAHRDDVEKDDEEVQESELEAFDDHSVGIKALRIEWIDKFCIVVSDANGEVQQVKNDESKNRQAAPDHDERGFFDLNALLKLVVVGADFLVLARELDGGGDVQHEGNEKADSREPDEGAVPGCFEKLRVFVESITAGVDQQVSGEVSCEKQDQKDSGDGDDEFFADGGLPISGGTACEGVHFKAKETATRAI